MLKEKWIVIDGSIYTDRVYELKNDSNKKYMARKSIAFNVGKEVADHIVSQHNRNLGV